MITIHHLENSRSQRVIWLCEELGVEYEVKHYKRNPLTKRAGKDFLEVHPLGKSPAISFEGKVYVESAAIFEFILDNFDQENKLHPIKSDKTYRDYIFWMHFAEGSLMGPLSMRYMHQVVESKVPFFIKPVAKALFGGIEQAYLKDTINSMFDYIESVLNKKKFLTGDKITAADILISFPLEVSVRGRVDSTKYPKIIEYVSNLKSESGYKKALEVGGPYDY